MERYSEIIKRSHWFIPKQELKKPLAELRRLFTVQGKYRDTEPIEIYAETDKSFGIPLYYRDMAPHADKVIDQTAHGSPIEFEFTATLRGRQAPVHNRFVQSIASGKHGFLLVAPTGTGKTILALDMLAELKTTALVVVPRDRIADQWEERILEHTSLTKEQIGRVQRDRCEFEGKAVTIGMIQSLMKDKYPSEFKRWPGVVVFDETHLLGAHEFNKVITMFPSAYKIAVSATPNRADGMEDAYKYHVAEETLTVAGGTDVKPTVILRGYEERKDRRHPYLHNINEAVNRRGVLLSHVAEDITRNALIAVYTKKFVESDRRTLVLSDRKDQLKMLQDVLVKRHGMPPRSVGMFVAETKKRERERVLNYCKVILATYGVMSMAVDVPNLRGLILATPQSDVEQPLGRILRMCEDTRDPVALDIIDVAYKDAVNWARNRQKHYEAAKVKVVYVENR